MMEKSPLISSIIFAFLISNVYGQIVDRDKPCLKRYYNHSSFVCVCNARHCDEISRVVPQPPGSYVMYSSSMEGLRFAKSYGTMDTLFNWIRRTFSFAIEGAVEINRRKTFQTIKGFGGSFTDSFGINVLELSKGAQDNLINTYFGAKGIEYSICRVPIAGSDFSTHAYAYNMEPEDDETLSNFSLTMEDYLYKIPLIKKAAEVSTEELLLMGSAWSPPAWMKTNGNLTGLSSLHNIYYQTWADYHLKFLQEYKKMGVNFWSLTTGNEPSHGTVPILVSFNSLGWTPGPQAKWVAENLGPTIKNSEFSHINIVALDDQRYSLPWWIQSMAENNKTMQYIDGIAVHWYWNDFFDTSTLDATHKAFPDKYLIASEACMGDRPFPPPDKQERVELGSWVYAEMYINDILEDLNHWFVGWIDWNLALSQNGGPNWYNNKVDAPIIVFPEDDEFLKQPTFYALGHFSKFIPRGSKRVHVRRISGFIDHVAFLRPDNGIAVVFYNPYDTGRTFTIREKGKGTITVNIDARSVHTLIYW